MRRIIAMSIAAAIGLPQPVLAANPFVATSSTNPYRGGANVGGTASGRFAVALNSPPQTQSFTLGGVGGGVSATPITCDLKSFAAQFNANATISKLGKDFKNFLAGAAQNYAVNNGLELAADAYARQYCDAGPGAAMIANEVAKRIHEEVVPAVAADSNEKIFNAFTKAVSTPKGAGIKWGVVPDPYSYASAGVAGARAGQIATQASTKISAGTAKIINEVHSKCIKGAKERFFNYVTTAMQILNGSFWNQLALDAQQCELEKKLTNANPAQGLLSYLNRSGTTSHDFGIFTVRLGGGGKNLVVEPKSKRHDEILRETAALTKKAVNDSSKSVEGRLAGEELKRWRQFLADFNAAMGDPQPDAAIAKVFDKYPVNDEKATDPARADYYISRFYFLYQLNEARAKKLAVEKDTPSDMKDLISAGAGAVNAALLVEVKKMHASLLQQNMLLARIADKQVGSGGGSAAASKDRTVTTDDKGMPAGVRKGVDQKGGHMGVEVKDLTDLSGFNL